MAEFAPPDPTDRSPARRGRGRGPARRWVLLTGVAATLCLACCGSLGAWVAVKGRLPAAADLPVLPRGDPATLQEAIDRIEAATDHKLVGKKVRGMEPQFGDRPQALLYYAAGPGGPLNLNAYCGLVVECRDERDADFHYRALLPPEKSAQAEARSRMLRAGRVLILLFGKCPEEEAGKVRRAFGL